MGKLGESCWIDISFAQFIFPFKAFEAGCLYCVSHFSQILLNKIENVPDTTSRLASSVQVPALPVRREALPQPLVALSGEARRRPGGGPGAGPGVATVNQGESERARES